ncbi:MAG TPA: hypothetical protein ENL03_02760 [Phycisphaerae bacterium]|nr:hypothetical protein [Phycisphaerae bacterium]
MAYREHIQEQLSAYFDGELSETEVRNVSAAIESDPLLAQELQKLRGVRQLYRTSDLQHAPRGFTDRVLEAVEREELMRDVVTKQAKASPFWKRSLAAAAITLIAAGIGIILVTGPDWFAQDTHVTKETGITESSDAGRQDPGGEIVKNPHVPSIDNDLAWMGPVTVATIMADNPQITSENVEDILLGSGAKAVSASQLKISASDAESNTICFTVRETSTGVVYVATGSKENLAELKLSLRNQLSTRFIDISKAAVADRSELALILEVEPATPGGTDSHEGLHHGTGTDLATDPHEKTEEEKFRELSEKFRKYLPKRDLPISPDGDDKGTTSKGTPKPTNTDDSYPENPEAIHAIYIKVIQSDW